jgi:hypothetical protein
LKPHELRAALAEKFTDRALENESMKITLNKLVILNVHTTIFFQKGRYEWNKGLFTYVWQF